MKYVKQFLLCYLLLFSFTLTAQDLPKLAKENINFMMVNDMGANNPSFQKPIANIMGQIADQNKIDMVIVAGDPIHGEGVQSRDDPFWEKRFESVYSAPSLMKLPWYPVCGNHEYRGSVQAVVDYSKKNPRWKMPALYYTLDMKVGKENKKCLFILLDTAPMVRVEKTADKNSVLKYIDKELNWLDSVLTHNDADWKFVIGHHPIYANTTKLSSDLKEMQQRVGKRIEAVGVDFYLCGHIHNFQYIRPAGTQVNYIINASASVNRESGPTDGTIWYGNGPGLTVFSISDQDATFYFVNKEGNVIFKQNIRK